jgi:hypothetical protein
MESMTVFWIVLANIALCAVILGTIFALVLSLMASEARARHPLVARRARRMRHRNTPAALAKQITTAVKVDA